MAYTRTTVINPAPGGDSTKQAVLDLDTDLTGAFAVLNAHEALTATHGAAGAIVGTTNTQVLTNKTINLASNTLTGSLAQFNTAVSDADICPIDSPTLTGTVTLPATTSIGAVSATELSYLGGVTSALQTQLSNKMPLTGTPSAVAFGAVTVAGATINGGTGAGTTYDAMQTLSRTSTNGSVLAGKLVLVEDPLDATNYGNLVLRVKSTASGAESPTYYTDVITIQSRTKNVLINTPTSLTGGVAKLEVNGSGYFAGGISATGSSVFQAAATATSSTVHLKCAEPILRFERVGGTGDKTKYELRAIASGGIYDYLQLRMVNDANTVFTELAGFSSTGLAVTGGINASGITQSAGGFYPQDNGWRPTTNYTHGFEILGDTQLRLWFKGADGVNRSTTLTLA